MKCEAGSVILDVGRWLVGTGRWKVEGWNLEVVSGDLELERWMWCVDCGMWQLCVEMLGLAG